MKNIYKVFAAAALLSIAACTPKAEYVTYNFVNIPSSAVVNEDVVLEIPIQTVAQSGVGSEGTQVQFKITEIVGANGVDYTVEPANGIVTTTMDTPGKIVVTPANYLGKHTGDYKLAIELTGVNGGNFTIGGAYKTSVTIKDIDHPLSQILGSYDVACWSGDASTGSGYSNKYTMELLPVDGDVTSVYCTALNYFPVYLKGNFGKDDADIRVIGKVSADKKTITFEPQKTKADLGYGPIWIYSSDWEVVDDELVEVCHVDEKIVYTATATGYKSDQGVAYIEEPGGDSWGSYYGFGLGNRSTPLFGLPDGYFTTTWTKK